jgi:Carboxypeptidase regulatory-like domain/TonB dependent receptor-like, beta-barrel
MNLTVRSAGVPASRTPLGALGTLLSSLSAGLAIVAFAFAVPAARAQTFRGAIVGTVIDQSLAPIPRAKVTVKNQATGLLRTTLTGEAGQYNVPELPIGTYTVTIEKEGFGPVSQADVAVDVASERRVEVELVAAAVKESIEVHAEVPQVTTTEDTLGGTLVSSQMENLPVNGRDYTKLIYLNPGVSGSPDQITDSPGSFGEFSMNGARGRSVNFLLDGTDMNDGYRNDPAINQAGVFGTPSTILPVDAVAELAVLSNFAPEYGRNAGAVVNIVTKSGTNQLHGTAAEYFRNDALDARNFFNPGSQPKAQFHNNQYGGSVGGPIAKDKTFFYGDYEGQQEAVGVVTLGCVPVGLASDGSLSPSQASNPVVANLLARHPWPAPNLGINTPCPNSSVISPSFNRLSSAIGKIDHNFNPENVITGRYFFGDSVQSFPLALTASGGQLPGFNTYTPTRVQLVSISYVHTLGPNKVNELRYGWNRFAEGFFPQDQSFAPSSIGLCAASTTAGCSGSGSSDSGLPIIVVGGVTPASPQSSAAQLGATGSVPRHRFDMNNQVIDDFSWKLNKHEVKVGVEFHRTTVQQYFDKYFRGKLEFNSLADFLSGTVDGGYQYAGDSTRNTFENSFGLYAQDNFRLTPHLTLNYGMRWDYFGVIGEANNLLSNVTSLDASTGTFTLTQVGQPGLRSLYNPDHKAFAPRLSAAWDVTGKGRTVVRAGFGVFFDASSQDMVLGHLPYPPYFDPGPAYNPLPGADPIYSAGVTGTIAPGVPVFGDETACNYECDSFAFDRNIKTPYMENYNLNIQQQITDRVVLSVGYVGSQGHRLWRFFDLNQPSQAAITASDLACTPAPCITPGYSVPRPYGSNPYGTFYLMQENSSGKSNYNSLQASLRLAGWHGVTSMVNYVWSRSMDNSSDGEDFEPNAAQPNDSTRPSLEYGPSNFNLPHRFTWILAYDFPQTSGSWQRLKNGWGFDSSTNLQSGQPFQFNYNFESDFSGSGEGDDRPDLVGPIVYDSHNPLNYVNLSSFAIPCTVTAATGSAADCVPGTRHFGNEGRDALHGPTFRQWDLAVYKNTFITERVQMQLRADFFNILNHPNFANPFLPAFLADPGINGFALNGSREVGAGAYPITATGDVGIGNPFLGGGGPRGIQLGVKFSF